MRVSTTRMTLATSLLLASTAFAGDAAKGKAAFAVCAGCHGANGEGNQTMSAPALAGQESWYLVRQLENFKAGIRGSNAADTAGATMKPMVATLADKAAMEDVAAYVATLPTAVGAATLKGDATAGKAAFATCAACHGATAAGDQTMGAPRLNLQQDWYMLTQLKNFSAGVRGGDAKDTFGMQMKPMAATLKDEKAMADVIAYIKTLK